MRKPKDATRAARQREALADRVLDASPELREMIADLDAEESKAQNVILPSEQPKPKGKAVRPGSKAPQKPTEAPTAKETKPATPVARQAKPKPSKPAKAQEEPKKFEAPEGWEKIEIGGVLIGYLYASVSLPTVYDAYDPDGNHLFFGVSRENILKRLKSSAAGASR